MTARYFPRTFAVVTFDGLVYEQDRQITKRDGLSTVTYTYHNGELYAFGKVWSQQKQDWFDCDKYPVSAKPGHVMVLEGYHVDPKVPDGELRIRDDLVRDKYGYYKLIAPGTVGGPLLYLANFEFHPEAELMHMDANLVNAVIQDRHKLIPSYVLELFKEKFG